MRHGILTQPQEEAFVNHSSTQSLTRVCRMGDTPFPALLVEGASSGLVPSAAPTPASSARALP